MRRPRSVGSGPGRATGPRGLPLSTTADLATGSEDLGQEATSYLE